MKLYINRYEHKEYIEKLLGICPLCLIEAMKAEFMFILEFNEEDDPYIDINKLFEEKEVIYGNYQ